VDATAMAAPMATHIRERRSSSSSFIGNLGEGEGWWMFERRAT
jgi:hypothetical protein